MNEPPKPFKFWTIVDDSNGVLYMARTRKKAIGQAERACTMSWVSARPRYHLRAIQLFWPATYTNVAMRREK